MAWPERLARPTIRRRLPVILSSAEVVSVLRAMSGTSQLMARLLYGTGMRLMESLQLRVKGWGHHGLLPTSTLLMASAPPPHFI
jgi:site-specific recombinase XerD